ncbi:hypothetical protein, partial [Escherichia coli]|uniref:hypothetical protein n=1 Tax=Escherichia coli TaxID=562 RepID=UPI0032E3D590
MHLRFVDNWCMLGGANVEIHKEGRRLWAGLVDAVTQDGTVLWVRSPLEGRKLFHKSEFQAWAKEERTGFHYRASSPVIKGCNAAP